MYKHIVRFFIVLLLALSSNARGQNYTVVISMDGFRWDYPQWYETPFIDYVASVGVESALIPSFPSKTFPNHYTLATGLYPDHHGIVANKFYDPSTGVFFSLSNMKSKYNPDYYGGEPIWLTAQKNGIKTAVFYWPGSDVGVKGQHPWFFLKYDEKPRWSFRKRVDGIVEMLNRPLSDRPRLIMAYFEQPDAYGHNSGPQSKTTRRAVEEMDALMRDLYIGIKSTHVGDSVNFIMLSDHGMTSLSPDRIIDIKKMLKPQWYEAVEGNVPANIYVKENCVDSVYECLKNVAHIRVWKKKDIPPYLHYGSNERVGEVVACPDLGWVFGNELEEWATHGFDPYYSDMHALFRAVGPDFRHVAMPHFPNVCVYPLLCRLLGIAPSENDGTPEPMELMLNERARKSGGE